jgi:aspartate kinase
MLFYQKFKVDFTNVTLYTIRHFTDAAAETVEEGKTLF